MHQDIWWLLVVEGEILHLFRRGKTAAQIATELRADVKTVNAVLKERFGTTFGRSQRGNVITGYEDWPTKCKCGDPFQCPYEDCQEA